MGLSLPIRALQDRANDLSLPGKHFLALDGSSRTAGDWLAPEIKAAAAAMGITEETLGHQCSDLLITQIVYPAIQRLNDETRANLGLIMDLNHFPLKNRSNMGSGIASLPKVFEDGRDIPFVTAVAQKGIPLFAKGDGRGAAVNHTVEQNGKDVPVWETVEQPDLIAGLKTHWKTWGKSYLETVDAAKAVAVQSAAAIANGITPMPEPDIVAMTSLGSEKVFDRYVDYYELLMKNLEDYFPGWDVKDIGALMGTKLGPVEDGELTNGPAQRSESRVMKKTAENTAKLILHNRENFGMAFHRMLTNGRELDEMLQLVDRTNKALDGKALLGSSFSSASLQRVLKEARATMDPKTNMIRFTAEAAAIDLLSEITTASEAASKGEMDKKHYPGIFKKSA